MFISQELLNAFKQNQFFKKSCNNTKSDKISSAFSDATGLLNLGNNFEYFDYITENTQETERVEVEISSVFVCTRAGFDLFQRIYEELSETVDDAFRLYLFSAKAKSISGSRGDIQLSHHKPVDVFTIRYKIDEKNQETLDIKVDAYVEHVLFTVRKLKSFEGLSNGDVFLSKILKK